MAVYGNGIINESYLVEFTGNQEKNQEFIETLKDVDGLCKYHTERLRLLEKNLEETLKYTYEIIKSPKVFKSKIDQCRKMIDDYNAWYEKASRNINGQVTWTKFGKLVRKFNNKFSKVTMEEKKKLDKELEELQIFIKKMAEPWCENGKKADELVRNLDMVHEIDQDYYKSFYELTNDLYKFFIKEVNYTNDDIIYTRKYLNVKSENSFMYKFINMILRK